MYFQSSAVCFLFSVYITTRKIQSDTGQYWYQNLSSKVKWKNTLSHPFPILQGVRQGDILSTGLYKTYINDLLHTLEGQHLGSFIGTTYIGCPTVADDAALLANTEEDLQLMLDVTYNYSSRERYIIHPQKSMVIPKITSKRSDNKSDWHIGDSDILVGEKGTHLGIIRAVKNELTININERISCARKTLYSLMGTSLHGTNGLPPTQCLNMYKTYVLPRLLYGLESFVPQQKDLQLLENVHVNFLRSIQAIPVRTSKSITHLMLGCRTITAEIHIRQLSLLGSIIRCENSTLINLLRRQVNLKSEHSKSWFIHVNNLLQEYQLPGMESLLITSTSKFHWKKQIGQSVDRHWYKVLQEDCSTKSSLKYCYFQNLKIGTVHPIWSDIKMNQKDIKRSSIKCRMITGTYILQSTLSKYNNSEVDRTCPLCRLEDENIVHFLTKCNSLHHYRRQYLLELKNLFDGALQAYWLNLTKDFILLTKLILDAGSLIASKVIPDDPTLRRKIEVISRRLCFSLHSGRTFLINTR